MHGFFFGHFPLHEFFFSDIFPCMNFFFGPPPPITFLMVRPLARFQCQRNRKSWRRFEEEERKKKKEKMVKLTVILTTIQSR